MLKSVTVLLISGIAAVAASAAVAVAQTPQAHAASSCSIGNGRGYGYTYVESLTVSQTSCSTGKSVVKHHGRLGGWHCSQKTLASSATQLIAQKTCTSGRKKVVYKFSQNK